MRLATQEDERELDCNNGHKPCMCAGRLECHNCGKPLDSLTDSTQSQQDNSPASEQQLTKGQNDVTG